MGIVLGGNCPGGNCIGGSYPGWEFSLVRVFRVGIVQWESSGGNFPGGAMFMLQVKNIFSKRFDVCVHQLILFITHLKFFFTTSYSDIYNKIVIIIML